MRLSRSRATSPLGGFLEPAVALLRVHLAGVEADDADLLLGALGGVRALVLAVVVVGSLEALAVHAERLARVALDLQPGVDVALQLLDVEARQHAADRVQRGDLEASRARVAGRPHAPQLRLRAAARHLGDGVASGQARDQHDRQYAGQGVAPPAPLAEVGLLPEVLQERFQLPFGDAWRGHRRGSSRVSSQASVAASTAGRYSAATARRMVFSEGASRRPVRGLRRAPRLCNFGGEGRRAQARIRQPLRVLA